MTKDDFLNRFSVMNTDIESALATQNFDRAMRIDAVRRQMLHDFTINLVPDGDKVFFETLERCAADNARAISKMNSEIGKVRHSASRNMRRLSG